VESTWPIAADAGEDRVDVAIVGGGLAGLTAARRLVAKGYSVRVLEARDRVGGRTLSIPIGGGKVIDLGGQWVGPLPGQASQVQDRILALATEVGVRTFKTYDQGDYIDYNSGKANRYKGRVPVNPSTVNVGAAQALLDQMAKQVPVDAPYAAAKAEEWDSQSVETWMQNTLLPPNQRPDSATYSLLNLFVESTFSAEPRDVSFLDLLYSIASAGGTSNIDNTTAGAQDSRLVGGAQRVSKLVADDLGDRVVLSSPVRKISQGNGAARVLSDRLQVVSRSVIVATPAHLAGRIQYDPPLGTFDGGIRDQLVQRMPMGSTIKVQCSYPTPFWRAQGLAGQVTSDTGPIKITFDNSPYPDSLPGILVGFMEGDDGRTWGQKSTAERRQATIDCFVRYFGSQAANPLNYWEMVWAAETYTGGCYGSFLPTGVWTGYGPALSRPLGLIHWAGSELSPLWNGYMDGAVRSGEAIAGEVAAAIGSPQGGAQAGAGPAVSLPNTSR
jgi:monoamine oxidase